MDPKTTRQLIKLGKQFIGIIAALFGEVGVRIIRQLVDEWLERRTKKIKTTKKRAKRKKSKRKI